MRRFITRMSTYVFRPHRTPMFLMRLRTILRRACKASSFSKASQVLFSWLECEDSDDLEDICVPTKGGTTTKALSILVKISCVQPPLLDLSYTYLCDCIKAGFVRNIKSRFKVPPGILSSPRQFRRALG